jgi:hypothetical protein
MSGALQAVYQNLRSFGFPNGWPANIGGAYNGGYFAGQIFVDGYSVYNLVVADKSVGEALKKWGPVGVATGFTSDINGPANSAGEAALGSTYEAATFCENLNTGGYTDWYLPAANELIVLYYFLKPGTTANNTGTGSNPNAVSPEPISTNFTSGDPAQTTATSFRTGASSQEFALPPFNYWASTEYSVAPYDENYARIRDFNTGDVGAQVKGTVSNYARAIRRVLDRVIPPTTIGQAFGGGFYAGKISTSADGVATHYLVVSNASVGQVSGKKWGPNAVNTGVTSVIAGPTNSASLAALGASYEAALFCENLNTGGYTDWYLPALNELSVCYYFLKPGTVSNVNYFGSNANAVSPQPVSTNYTAGSPTQTSATNFRTGASSQEFPDDLVWTSTQYNNDNAYVVQFINGNGQSGDKADVTHFYTRAIRRVAV